MLKIYVVQNAEGKYLRSKGYSGSGESWVDDIKNARAWFKPGPARSQVTWWASNYPDYPIPNIIELTAGNPVVLDETKRVQKVIQKKAEKEAEFAKRQAERNLKIAKENAERANKVLNNLMNGNDNEF